MKYRAIADGPVVQVPGWGRCARFRIVAEGEHNVDAEFMDGPNAGRVVRVRRGRCEEIERSGG